ncbi:Pentatricopeptide repeat [Dillenia turbinata]|uniref:Pentatricopeptide repeat n=1 Tax=Dillenia turbinata TaxID=194707 RepID=A0AAN8UFP8_9MAGN
MVFEMEMICNSMTPSPFVAFRCQCVKNGSSGGSSKLLAESPLEYKYQFQIGRCLQTSKQKQHELPLVLREPTKARRNLMTDNTKKKKNDSSSVDALCLMDSLGLPVTYDVYASLINECTESQDPINALELYSNVIDRIQLLQPRLRLTLQNKLLLMLVTCGSTDAAHQLFAQMTLKDFWFWAILIAGYIEIGEYENAIEVFIQMQCSYGSLGGVGVWRVITVGVLKACVLTKNAELGKQLHCLMVKFGDATDLLLCTSLINFYGKIGHPEEANFLFNKMKYSCDTVAWTAAMASYCHSQNFIQVLYALKDMKRLKIKLNNYTLSTILRACGRMGDCGECGRQVHADVVKLGLESDMFVQCSLVDMYGKCGSLRDARRIFDMSDQKESSIACWNAMLHGYARHKASIEAIKFLYQMKAAGFQPQESILNQVRIACCDSD